MPLWLKIDKEVSEGSLFQDDKKLRKQIMKIQTQSLSVEEPKDPDQCNVYKICRLFLTLKEDEALRKRYEIWGLSYKDAKDQLFEKFS